MKQLLGRTKFFFNKEWHKAVIQVERFFKLKEIDDDLAKEALKIQEDSRNKMNEIIKPLLKKAKKFKEGQDLKNALIKLSIDNTSTLTPDPLYSFFYYSHPPIQERIEKMLNSNS